MTAGRGGAASRWPGIAARAVAGATSLLRFWFNLPLTVLVSAAALLAGGSCHVGPDLLVVWTGVPRWLNGPRGGMTIGNVFLTAGPPPGPPLRRHELRHAGQWAMLGPVVFPVAYAVAEAAGRMAGMGPAGNLFERLAGLAEGGYGT